MSMKIMTVYGTRPEAIKVAPIINALERSPHFESVTVSTGQHREMLDQVNNIFGISPRYDLGIMAQGQSLNDIAVKIFAGLGEILAAEQPAAVLVQGDTSSALYAALAAFNLQIPVVHLEAGLRSGNIHSPFPEEGNRRVISQVASLHLAPTEGSKKNLLREGFSEKDIAVTGNSVIDALLSVVGWQTDLPDERVEQAVASGQRLVLVTTHRRENLGDAMQNIGRALGALAKKYSDCIFIFPAHKNPAMREAVLPHLEGLENVVVTEPLPYMEFTQLLAASYLVLTDSGGLQEEAPSLGKPVLVLRKNTERPEAVDAGTVRLVGTDTERIVAEVSGLLDIPELYRSMSNAVNPYGDGAASGRTIAALEAFFGLGKRLPDFSV